MKILVVDDIEANVYQLQVLLGANGYKIDTAANGVIALEIARRSPPDLIITDILMPVMDGYSLCREWMLDERLKSIPLVFYTATYIDEKDRAFGLNLGAARFIVKPEEPDVFLRMVADVLAKQTKDESATPRQIIQDETVYLKEYSEALIRKLEDKNEELEQANRQLARDIVERQRVERQLREQNEILSKSHEGVVIVSLDNKVSLWNRGAETMFGWTAAEALGRDSVELFNPTDHSIVALMRAAVLDAGFWNGEQRMRSRGGRALVVDSHVTLVRDEAGRPIARLNILADITEKKLLEEKFFHAQRLESLGMLAAGIAHDLNNTLAPIMFAAPMLRHSLTTPGDRKILDMLDLSAARGTGLVKQILAFAHSSTGDPRPTQIKHLACDIISLIEETFPKSIQLDRRIQTDLWPVMANPTQIHQVLLNLCVNARDAMPHGGTLRISATNRRLTAEQVGTFPGARPGAWIVIEVADTGTGIAPAALAHIWEPFFTTKEAGKGTGLGLSTVRAIVTSHHGYVELDTSSGHGTTFRVFLPAAEGESCEAVATLAIDVPTGRDELILVVDDDRAVRELIVTILKKHGFRVLSASNGVEAVTHFTAHATEFALVITDVEMPLFSGTVLARLLLQLRPDLRLLAISGRSSSSQYGAEVHAAEQLMQAFLLKPFTPEDLLSTVNRLIHPAPTV